MFLETYVEGTVEGEVLKLDEPLSFWGGFDPSDGVIIDSAHPQRGQSIAGKVLVLPYARGSAGTPAGVCEAIRAGCGPCAVLVREPDANLATGLKVAAHLYGLRVTSGQVPYEIYESLVTEQKLMSR